MGHRFLALYSDITVAEALDRVRGSGFDPELVAVVFVADRDRRLCGSVALKRLLESPATPGWPMSWRGARDIAP